MLHSICQQIWLQYWKRSVFIPIPKKGNAKECSNYRTIALISMATHSSVLAWGIPGMAEPGGLPSMGLHRVRHDWSDLAVAAYASKVILKILQSRHQQYMNHELPDVQARFRKGRGTRDQIANIHWIIEKAREFQKNISFYFIDYAKFFDCVDHQNFPSSLENSSRDKNSRPPDLPPEKCVCRSRSNS